MCKPVLWIVLPDEFAGLRLIDTYEEGESSTVQQLSAMARAAGIFLISAEKRLEDHRIPLQLRGNLENHLIARVESLGI